MSHSLFVISPVPLEGSYKIDSVTALFQFNKENIDWAICNQDFLSHSECTWKPEIERRTIAEDVHLYITTKDQPCYHPTKSFFVDVLLRRVKPKIYSESLPLLDKDTGFDLQNQISLKKIHKCFFKAKINTGRTITLTGYDETLFPIYSLLQILFACNNYPYHRDSTSCEYNLLELLRFFNETFSENLVDGFCSLIRLHAHHRTPEINGAVTIRFFLENFSEDFEILKFSYMLFYDDPYTEDRHSIHSSTLTTFDLQKDALAKICSNS